MSDEFDKEAEREKLREKFEKDAQKRQETQRMSELLLQGATMTNEHCENCGDPLFRDGERTFCPTCGGPGGEAGEQAAEQAQEQTQQPTQTHTETQPQQSEAPTRSNGTEPAPQEPTDAGIDEQPTQPRQPPEPSTPSEAEHPRAELQRAVTTTARRANEATDPRTAKAWLEASKEAAEALAALER